MSFDEINAYLEVMQQKEKDILKYDITLAFYNAAFTNAKKPYDIYRQVINDIDKQGQTQTDEDMEKMAKKLNAMFGGTVKKGGD